MTETTHTPLPCPFCGGNKVLISQTLDQKAPNWFAACHRATCAFTGYSSTEAEALTAWNTRAVNSHHELIEALREAREAIKHRGGPLCSSRYYSNGQCDCGATEAIAKIDAILTKEAGQ